MLFYQFYGKEDSANSPKTADKKTACKMVEECMHMTTNHKSMFPWECSTCFYGGCNEIASYKVVVHKKGESKKTTLGIETLLCRFHAKGIKSRYTYYIVVRRRSLTCSFNGCSAHRRYNKQFQVDRLSYKPNLGKTAFRQLCSTHQVLFNEYVKK